MKTHTSQTETNEQKFIENNDWKRTYFGLIWQIIYEVFVIHNMRFFDIFLKTMQVQKEHFHIHYYFIFRFFFCFFFETFLLHFYIVHKNEMTTNNFTMIYSMQCNHQTHPSHHFILHLV